MIPDSPSPFECWSGHTAAAEQPNVTLAQGLHTNLHAVSLFLSITAASFTPRLLMYLHTKRALLGEKKKNAKPQKR